MKRLAIACALALIAGDVAADETFAHAPFELTSFVTRWSAYAQSGHGFQSRAGPPGGPGDEALFVLEPEIAFTVEQGSRIEHRVILSADVVTAASPSAIDVVSKASARNEAGSVDWAARYRLQHGSLGVRAAFHGEENYHAFLSGFEASRGFAEDNTVLGLSFFESIDWMDAYLVDGTHNGVTGRSAFNANASLTQILSPTTIATLGYGFTEQSGTLSNGWNVVPTYRGGFALERVPVARARHAATVRAAQWLPWRGALKVHYRFYDDDWGILAHAVEGELDQRLASFAYVGGTYRVHHQTAADFFTTRALPFSQAATADSDLDRFYAQSVGAKVVVNLVARTPVGTRLHLDAAFERYFRSNDLRVTVISCSVGFLP